MIFIKKSDSTLNPIGDVKVYCSVVTLHPGLKVIEDNPVTLTF